MITLHGLLLIHHNASPMSRPGVGPLLEIRHCAGIPRTAAGFKPARRGATERRVAAGRGRTPVTHDHHGAGTTPHDADTVPPPSGGTPGPEVATLVQGRFKRDGSAAAEQEPHGGTDRGSSAQHAQNPGPAAAGDSGDRAQRPGAAASGDTDPGTSAKSRGPSTPAPESLFATGASAPVWSPCSPSPWSPRPRWVVCGSTSP